MFEVFWLAMFIVSISCNALALFVIVEGFLSHRKINKFLSSFKLQLAPNDDSVDKSAKEAK
jgi:hypothetical protein